MSAMKLALSLARARWATVYEAVDTRLGRKVALKVLRAEHAQDTIFRARFQREAEAVAALNHHSIVGVYDTGGV
jgi:serine/threonine protein kinase